MAHLKLLIAQRASAQYVHLWSGLGSFADNPMGINWAELCSGSAPSFQWATGRQTFGRAAHLSAKDIRSAEMAPIIGAGFKMMVPADRDSARPSWFGFGFRKNSCRNLWSAQRKRHSYNDVLPLMLARYCGPGLLGLGITAADCGIYVRHGG